MLYFKHSELVNDYHVSLKTVHNWIDAAKQGKLELQLHEVGGRTYVANNPANVLVLEKLADRGKKYRNSLHQKVVMPKPEFYELYSRRQTLDIITNLDIYHEIPRQYNYFNGGAHNWDGLAKRLSAEENSNMLKATIALIDDNLQAIDHLIEGKKKINVIDIGPGNGMPVKGLLAHLISTGKLHRYVAVDISKSMLEIVEKNIKRWFGEKISFEGYIRDITYERLDDLWVDDMLSEDAEDTMNLALLLGATPMNFRVPYDAVKVIANSLGVNDVLLYSDKVDTEASRRYFNFNPDSNSDALMRLSPNHKLILEFLNIDDSFYDVEMGFNKQERYRYIRVRFKVSLTIRFKFGDGIREIHINKGDAILLWRVWHQTAFEVVEGFEKVGLALRQASLTSDRQYLLTISGVATDSTGEV